MGDVPDAAERGEQDESLGREERGHVAGRAAGIRGGGQPPRRGVHRRRRRGARDARGDIWALNMDE